MTITEMADELDWPKEFVAEMYRRATVYFNIHTIRLEKGISVDDLIERTGIEASKVRQWDKAGQIMYDYMTDNEAGFDQAFVNLLRDGEGISPIRGHGKT